MNYTSELTVILGAALDAGREILRLRAQSLEVEEKPDGSPVTNADIAADQIIRSRLSAAFEKTPILTEESADTAERLSSERCFIVDPLDGTREFLKESGEFTVNIALVHAHRPIIGVIYAPCLDKLWYAAEGVGAFRADNASSCSTSRLMRAAVRIHASDRLEQLTILVSRSSTELLGDTLERIPEISHTGSASSSLKGCLIAQGSAELSLCMHSTYEWDTAAMQCIVKESGAALHLLDGSEPMYNRPNPLNEQGYYLCNRPESLKVIDKILGS